MKKLPAKLFLLLLILAISVFIKARIVYGQSTENNIEISPSIIDQSGKARDILESKITITNHSSSTANLYTLVSDFDEQNNLIYLEDVSNLSKATSMIPWINIKRGVIELSPGQSVEVPLRIEVNLSALPGKYYSVIVFGQGSSRSDAVERAKVTNQPKVMVNLNIEDEVIEKAQLVSYGSNKNIFLDLPVSLNLEMKNIGNKEIIPKGAIKIYDRRGQEVATLAINDGQKNVPPDTNIRYDIRWDNPPKIGKFKAKLDLEYGEKNVRDLSDVVFFWILPLKYIIIVGSVLFISFIFIIISFLKILRPHENFEPEDDGTINLKSH